MFLYSVLTATGVNQSQISTNGIDMWTYIAVNGIIIRNTSVQFQFLLFGAEFVLM